VHILTANLALKPNEKKPPHPIRSHSEKAQSAKQYRQELNMLVGFSRFAHQ
jgi:hypothetical protein